MFTQNPSQTRKRTFPHILVFLSDCRVVLACSHNKGSMQMSQVDRRKKIRVFEKKLLKQTIPISCDINSLIIRVFPQSMLGRDIVQEIKTHEIFQAQCQAEIDCIDSFLLTPEHEYFENLEKEFGRFFTEDWKESEKAAIEKNLIALKDKVTDLQKENFREMRRKTTQTESHAKQDSPPAPTFLQPLRID